MLRRIGVLASLAVVAAMFVGSSTAQAQTGGVCVFTGLAGTLTPGIPNAIPDLQGNPTNPIDFEKGQYVYSSSGGGGTALCAGLFNGAPVAPTTATIDSTGGYDNILCGTGFAHDVDGDQTTVSAGALQLGGPGDPAGYQIPFVAGVGPLLIGPNGAPNLGETVTGNNVNDPNNSVTSNYIGTGLVQITPGTGAANDHDNCITPDLTGVNPALPDGETNAFQVKGFLIGARLP